MDNSIYLHPPIAPCWDYNPGPLWNRLTCTLNKTSTAPIYSGRFRYCYMTPQGVEVGPLTSSEICTALGFTTQGLAVAKKRGYVWIKGHRCNLTVIKKEDANDKSKMEP